MTRLLIGLLLGVVVLLGAAPATAEPVAAQPPPTTAPAGPQLDQPTEEDAEKSKNKLIIGITAVVLLGGVVYGNRYRAKRRKS
ncbi:MAG: hypothetical protein M3548_13310 [Actinomycetota bacterium]|nr:hypothetical protein [Actinomycetota bacterium]